MSANGEAASSVQNGDVNSPHIEFLYFASCSNASAALALLRDVLRTEAVSSEIEMIAVETEEAAQRNSFFGSPTIRINGVDISPPPTSATPSLACRLYVQPDGHYAPHPPADVLVEALRRTRRDANT
ncbi:MAG TPA: hypothetical protein VFX24_12095 [Ktedonobacterales bacterium]|nr:hypothetical protein [Ktedonobacterales bacterium]